jgi:hypothetical protein
MPNIKIWLDDERNPQDPITQQQFGAISDETWIKTAEEAIQLIESGNVSSISLDHDLRTEKTGLDVANFIEEQAFKDKIPKLHWRIHSTNSTEKEKMEKALKKADKFWRFK